eukprot:3932521-Amphidinium_carterae.1
MTSKGIYNSELMLFDAMTRYLPTASFLKLGGSTSSAAIAAALQRRAHPKINQKPTCVPMTPILEETVPPSEPGSYRSADEPDPVEEQ